MLLRVAFLTALAGTVAGPLAAQAPGKWPPNSLVNTKVIPKDTPVMQVVGQMRNITGASRSRSP